MIVFASIWQLANCSRNQRSERRRCFSHPRFLNFEQLEDRQLFAASDWQTFGNGAAHTGYVPGQFSNNLPSELRWSRELRNLGMNQAVTGDGLVFVSGQNLSALDAKTGQEVWHHEFEGSIGPPTYNQGKIYLQKESSPNNSQLWAFDALTGLIDWTAPYSTQISAQFPPTVSDGSVYVEGGSYGGLYGFRQSDGVFQFYSRTGFFEGWTPAVQNGNLYSWVGSVFTQHSTTTGNAIWKLDLSNPKNIATSGITNSVPVISGNYAYVNDRRSVSESNGLYRIDLQLRERTFLGTDNYFTGSPAVSNHETYAIFGDRVRVFNPYVSRVVEIYAGEKLISNQPILTDDKLIVSSEKSTFIFDRVTGRKLLTLPVGGNLSLANDTLYIASKSGVLYAYAARVSPFLAVQLPAEANENEGKLIRKGQVRIGRSVEKDLMVDLRSSVPQLAEVPRTVTIEHGSTFALFDIILHDNTKIDSRSIVIVTASSPGFDTGTASISILDDESAVPSSIEVDWLSRGNGPSHSGYVPGNLGEQTSGNALWSKAIAAGQVVTGEGLIFAMTANSLVAMDAKSSAEIWRYTFGGNFKSEPTYADGHIYVLRAVYSTIGADSQLWSFDASSGKVDWSAPLDSPQNGFEAWPPIVNNGVVYVSGSDVGKTFGFKQTTGEQVFSWPDDGWFSTSSDGRIFEWTYESFRELNPNGLGYFWVLNVGNQRISKREQSIPAIADQKAFLITDQGLVCIDLVNHRQIWRVEGYFAGSPSADRTTVFAIQQGVVRAFDAATGALRGVYDAGSLLIDRPIITDDALIVNSGYSTSIFDRKTRSIRQTLSGGKSVSLANNTLYVSQGEVLSAYAWKSLPSVSITMPSRVDEALGKLVGQSTIQIPIAPANDLVITLDSTDPSRLKLPATVRILAGRRSTTFDIETIDNAILDINSPITIKAYVRGYNAGIAMLQVLDDEFEPEAGLAGDWDSFGNGPSHTGYFPGIAGAHLTSKLLWETNFGTSLNPVVINNGSVFVSNGGIAQNSFLAAINPSTGSESWRYNFATSLGVNPPSYSNGHVFVQSKGTDSESKLFSLDATTGSVRWVSPVKSGTREFLAPTLSDGSIYLGGGTDIGLYRVNQDTGEKLFSKEVLQYDAWTPTVFERRLFTWVGGTFTEYSPTSGESLWTLGLNSIDWPSNLRSVNSAPVIDAQKAFVYSMPGWWVGSKRSLFAIDLNTQHLLWEVTGAFAGTPAVAQGQVFAIQQSLVKAYDSESGTLIRQYDAGEMLFGQPIVTDDSIIVSGVKQTYVIDRATGAISLKIPASGHVSLSNNTLLIASALGVLSAYELGPQLTLRLPINIFENAGKLAAQGSIAIEKPIATNLTVRLTSSDSGRVKIPSTVTILASETIVYFDIEAIDNSLVDLDKEVGISATALGYFNSIKNLRFLDDEPAVLTLSLPSVMSESSGKVHSAGVLSVKYAPAIDTLIELRSSASQRLTIPSSVILKANTKSVDFDITPLDNLVEDGPLTVQVSAESKNWMSVFNSILVLDDEIPSLTLIAPVAMVEGSGMASGSIWIPYPLKKDLVVELSSIGSNLLTLPAFVTIPAGTQFVNFDIAIANDSLVLGPRKTIVRASSSGYTFSSLEVIVVEDEVVSMSLRLPNEAREGSGRLTNAGEVRLSRNVDQDVEIDLYSSDAEKISLPSKVVVLAGHQSALFDITVLDNWRVDGSKLLRVNASVPNWLNAHASVKIRDDDQLGLNGDWKTYGNGVEHSGYFPGFIGTRPVLTNSWTKSLGNQKLNQVSTGGGLVFVTPDPGIGGNFLVALDATTGAEAWRYTFEKPYIIAPITYDNGHLYMKLISFVGGSQLWALDASTGSVEWKTPIVSQLEPDIGPIVSNGSIFLSGGTQIGLLGFNLSNGVQRFFQAMPIDARWEPSSYNSNLYTWVDDIFREHNTSNGEVAKSLNLQSHLPNSSNVSIPVIDDKRAFVIGSSGLVGIDLVTRKKLWTVEGAFSGIPVAAHGTVFVVQQGYLRAMDAATGEPKGAFETGEPISEQPIVTDDSIILASNRTTFIFDRTTKELVGTLPIGGRISIANNAFYVATEGLINAFAINPKSAWQNPSESLDVNGDGSISPLDVLVLVNKLNTTGSIRLDSRPPDSYFLDVDGDGFLTPLDPLIVINWVNSTAGLAEGESTSENNSHSQKNALNEVMVDTIFGHKSWLDDDSLVGKRTGKIRYASIGRPPGS